MLEHYRPCGLPNTPGTDLRPAGPPFLTRDPGLRPRHGTTTPF